jgi:hypothetical protein
LTSDQTALRSSWKQRIPALCACFALATAIVPFARAFFRVEVNYNEGWNIYNAGIVANHQLLYPVKYAWTTVNYPMLSFFILAQLHRLTHDYLFTARAVSLLSLIGCSLLVGAIVRNLTGSWRASSLAGFYCLALFCTDADFYVGADDPQMFAQVFFLAGLLLYLWRRQSFFALTAAALLFVVGGSIKHNPIDFPLALLLELCLVSLRRAIWFSVWGLLFAGIAVALNTHFGGPAFLSQLLAPRGYSAIHALSQLVDVFGPLLLPFCVALFTAFILRKDEKRRIAAILLATTLVVGGYFGGGQGVSINALFSALLAMAILIGLFSQEVVSGRWEWANRPQRVYAPLLLFGWLIIPWIISGNLNPIESMHDIAAEQRRFDQDVALLRDRPGPALCESLLRCYFAGKSYDYDPFNATRFIRLGKLDASTILEEIHRKEYGAVQLDSRAQDEKGSERFEPSILAAIQSNYVPALEQEDTVIYVPKAESVRPLLFQPEQRPQ